MRRILFLLFLFSAVKSYAVTYPVKYYTESQAITNSYSGVIDESTITFNGGYFRVSLSSGNPSLSEFDTLVSSVIKITANESNGIVSFYTKISVKSYSILSEGGYNTVMSTSCGNIVNIPDGMPDNVTLPRIVVNPVFTWTLTAGTTLHIQVVGGK